MIVVLGTVQIQADQLAQALALSLEHVHRSRSEPGCLSHRVSQDAEDPLRLLFVEEWSDRAALRRHFEVPESRTFVRQLTGFATGAPRIVVYSASAIEP